VRRYRRRLRGEQRRTGAAQPRGLNTVLTLGGGDMRRREFITFLSGAAATACPLAAHAQQANRTLRIGVLQILTIEDAESQARNAAFLHGLQQLGCRRSRGRGMALSSRPRT
jgi:hypothetical protein